jgi:hypothetical protein
MGVAMRKPLSLTDSQMQAVRTVAATLRLNARDRFFQALACELARGRYPPSDSDLHVAIRSLLGVTPVNHFIREEAD